MDNRLSALKSAGRTALVPFITAGDPAIEITVPVMHALVSAGADIIELGMPFSDPMADGPTIQQSSERALARGVGVTTVLRMVADFRQADAESPVVLMGYLNPVEIHGIEAFVREAAEAGVDGLLLVDSPPEESEELGVLLEASGLHQIQLASPTTSDERLRLLMDSSRGYLYYVSLSGVTGAGTLDHATVKSRIDTIHAIGDLPVAVGFGVKDAASAAAIGAVADGVVIGSALVSVLHDAGTGGAAKTAGDFLAPIRAALDAG
ncbi:MAG: tryptophan synthase subunit alpha [Xanthomonadales bacterium]|nr:tryptophan synthase subunit alpha [Xanthomonadales bacterium]